MVVSRAANSDSFKVTTPSDHEIHMTRLFDAPRNLVFEAMTKPEHVTQWWGRLPRRVPGDHAPGPARVHGNLRGVPRRRHGGDGGFHRRGRQDATDGG